MIDDDAELSIRTGGRLNTCAAGVALDTGVSEKTFKTRQKPAFLIRKSRKPAFWKFFDLKIITFALLDQSKSSFSHGY